VLVTWTIAYGRAKLESPRDDAQPAKAAVVAP
jgi:hypothetical protein